MARARIIKPDFFKNEQLAECSPWARLLFAGLWTLADRDGRLEYRPKRIKAELFPFDAVEIPELAVELHGKKLLVIYGSGNKDGLEFIAIPSFEKHQRPHPKEPSLGFPQPPDVSKTYGKAVKRNCKPRQNTANCALPSFNPLILQSSNPSPSAPESSDSAAALVAEWNATSGVRKVLRMTPERRKSINLRLSDPDWQWREALAKFPLKCFDGETEGFIPDLEFFLRPKTVLSILEGKYDWSKNSAPKKSELFTSGEFTL